MIRNVVACAALVVVGLFSTDGWAAKRPIRAVNLQAGQLFMCAILETGDLKCWGQNDKGQLGQENILPYGDKSGTMGDLLPVVNLGKGRKVVSFSGGRAHSCAILDNKTLKCWGCGAAVGLETSGCYGDNPGTMGDKLPAVNLGKGHYPVQITTGYDFSCALLENGDIKCWGDNTDGQLGIGNTKVMGKSGGTMGDALPRVELGKNRKAIKIASGFATNCALLDNYDVKCWGFGQYATLGSESSANVGTAANQMGDNLKPVKLGAGRTAKDLGVFGFHACAILDNDSVKCWGINGSGALGIEDDIDRGDTANSMGDALPVVDLGKDAVPIAMPDSYCDDSSCVILLNGTVKCWGSNAYGQLGLGDVNDRGSTPGTMGENLKAIYFGKNEGIVDLATMASSTCALNNNGYVKCFGYNGEGNLGYGDVATRGASADTVPSKLPYVDLGTIDDKKLAGE